MARTTVYGYSSERDFLRAARATRIVEKMELRPKKGRKPPRGLGGGGDFRSCVGYATTAISPATENGDARSPGGGQIEITSGDGDVDVQNWSLVEIPEGTWVICIDVGGQTTVIDAFC